MRQGHLVKKTETNTFYLIEFDLLETKKSRKDLLKLYLYGGSKYYYYKNKRKSIKYSPLIDDRDIIGAGKGAVMTTREGFQRLKKRIENLKIKIKEKGVFYK